MTNNILGLNDAVNTLNISNIDFGTSANQTIAHTKLDLINANINSTNSKLDVLHSDEINVNNKLTSVISNTTDTNTKLDTLNNKDFSTSAKQDISNTYLNNMNYILNNSFSALGRLYTQTAYEVFQSKFDTNTVLDFYDYSYTSTGVSVNSNTSTLELVSTSAQTKQFQTKYKAHYEAGKSTELYFTAQLYESVNPNSSTYFGLFNSNNGLIIGYDGTTNDIRIIRRTNTSGSVVNNIIPRTSFNLNTLNGFDFTKMQLWHVHVLWFGYGYYHFSLVHNGQLIKFHEEFLQT